MIIAETGLDMTRFPTPAHLVAWAKLCPRTIQSGPITRGGRTGKGNPYLKGALGQAAAAAARTDTFLGQRYRRIVKRRGKLKALVAVARSILVIVWHLLADPLARFHDLGSDYHTRRIDIERRMRTTSPNSPPSATESPSNPPPEPPTTHRTNIIRLRKLRRMLSRVWSPWVIYRSGSRVEADGHELQKHWHCDGPGCGGGRDRTGIAAAQPDDGEGSPITGEALAKASQAALAFTGGGTVTGTEVGDEESLYEVEVTMADGSQVDVQLNDAFAVVSNKTKLPGRDTEPDAPGN